MKLSETGDLLTLNAALDRFATASKQSADRAVAWYSVFEVGAPSMTFDDARQLVIEYYADAGESLTPYALIEAWKKSHRLLPHQVAADVRSARARRLVGEDWNEHTPLTPNLAEALRRARAGEQAELAAHPSATRALTE